MNNKISYLETSTKKYPICFNINVMEEIQEQYGSLDKWGDVVQGDGEPKIKDLKIGLMFMINEAIDMYNDNFSEKQEHIDSKKVGRIISEIGFTKITEIIGEISRNSTKTDDEQKNA